MRETRSCCCGQCQLYPDQEACCVDDICHESIGEGRYCAPIYEIELRDLRFQVKTFKANLDEVRNKLTAALALLREWDTRPPKNRAPRTAR